MTCDTALVTEYRLLPSCTRNERKGEPRVQLQGKKVIALGERDGVQGSAIAECARSAGAEVVLETTYCFV